MRRLHPEYDMCPQTYILTDDYKKLTAEQESDPSAMYIMKPVASSCGRGIKVFGKSMHIPNKK